MRTFVEAVTGPPGILFTAALVVAVCFWLLVVVGVVAVVSFDADADADLGTWSMGGVPVPVAVAVSLLTAITWLVIVGVAVLPAALVTSGPATGALRFLAPVGALLVSWRLTRLSIRLPHRFPDEPAPPALVTGAGGRCSRGVLAAGDRAA
ncbi:hypothetical protein [Streptomyces aureus]|uniref:hypothetical protein n=1 Tax=Streptomyces aureus TaxID=193461 RepID=UPI0007C531B3|nr:hypothetical protein [Streptomyces aureus]